MSGILLHAACGTVQWISLEHLQAAALEAPPQQPPHRHSSIHVAKVAPRCMKYPAAKLSGDPAASRSSSADAKAPNALKDTGACFFFTV